MTTVLYIAGYGRSGSTVLDTILGNHPDVFGAGELDLFLSEIANGGICTCGETYLDCPLWGNVTGDVFDSEDIAAEAERLSADFCGLEAGLRRGSPTGPDADRARRYGTFWHSVFSSICAHGTTSVVVDSSKSAVGTAQRLHELTLRADVDLRVLHLVRDPRAVLYSSWIRGNNVALEHDEQTVPPSVRGLLRPLVGWLAANLAVTLSAMRLADLPVLRVRYEDLVDNPARTLASIGAFADIDLAGLGHRLDDGDLVSSGHGVAGNRMRRSGAIRLRSDTEWVAESPRLAKFAGPLFAPAAAAYGYSTMRWPVRRDDRDAPAIAGGRTP